MNEKEWIIELVDFPKYFISNYGRVFSERVGNKMRELKLYPDKDGYLIVGLMKEGKRYTKSVHRLVGETFLKIIKDKNEVDHKNRIKTDNRLENLRWCNRRENQINKGMRSDNKSGIKGVSYFKRDKYWKGSIYIEENKRKQKYFKKKEDAIKWRLEMETKYYN